MGVLGIALGKYLKNLKGLYSVEIPARLYDEAIELVNTCNEAVPKRALLVVNGGEGQSLPGSTIQWPDLLGWRTDDDRIFVWERGNREPDTSFQSVVKPFISSKFPGDPQGECSLELLATLCTEEIFKRHGLEPLGVAYNEFLTTSIAIAGILRCSFEKIGSRLGTHWSDGFLIHWAKTYDLLDKELNETGGKALEGKHAWELFRLAGLLAPREIIDAGNPFQQAPREIEEKMFAGIANRWQEYFDMYLHTEEERAAFFTILDSVVKGDDSKSSWRGLNWDKLNTIPATDIVAAPVLGQIVFTSQSSPSMLTCQPHYPIAEKPSWWGVTEQDVEEAKAQINKSTYFRPAADCSVCMTVSGQADTYMVKTRDGIVSPAHTRKAWGALLVVSNIEMEFGAPWKNIILSPIRPDKAKRGYSWIDPESVKLDSAGRGLKVIKKSVETDSSRTILLVKFDLEIVYDASESGDNSGILTGKWNPIHTLKIGVQVNDCQENSSSYGSPRKVDASIKLIVPSPFSPTVIVIPKKGRPFIAPDSRDDFECQISKQGVWETKQTLDVVIKEEGLYELVFYNGSVLTRPVEFSPNSIPSVNDTSITPASNENGLYSCSSIMLDDNDIVNAAGREIVVVKVEERSASLSSGLISVVRGLPAGQKPPSSAARSSLLGKYQDEIVRALCKVPDGKLNSLYQYILSTNEQIIAWPPHPGYPLPKFLFGPEDSLNLQGIGRGPSDKFIRSDAWVNFMAAMQQISNSLGLVPGAEATWLSGIDPGILSATLLRKYIFVHKELIRTAKSLSAADAFWACFPFSIIVVDGKDGATFGKLLSVLLSPLHPVRLAWAYTVSLIAHSSKSPEKKLMGLAEGWNFPMTGFTINLSGQKMALVSVPTDPGLEQDFITWSALATLDDGVVNLPPKAMGFNLPWAGQTGINHEVVTQALKDYLSVHPFVNSLELDIRSVSQSPRSREMDEAILDLLGGADVLDEVDALSGGIRVWDSCNRLGHCPTRDDLGLVRDKTEQNHPFEWVRYQPANAPRTSDIAFIENSSVHLYINEGIVNGVVGPLPFRRYCPSELKEQTLEYSYTLSPTDDILGLASLLTEIERFESDIPGSLKAIPQQKTLGVGLGAKWEILGTFYVDPRLLSSLVTSYFNATDKRLLWEWRPSWLTSNRKDTDIARRPYYVIGKIPASLIKALEYRHGLSEAQSFEMLLELGRRGIGLASLHASGGTQESAAAGYFYAIRSLLPPNSHSLSANWVLNAGQDAVCSILPIDPIQNIIEDLAGDSFKRRADFFLVIIEKDERKTNVCLIPVEVKYHGSESNPEQLPGDSNEELKRAREQLAQTMELTNKIIERICSGNVLDNYSRLVGLTVLTELAMSLAPTQLAAEKQAKIINDILNGNVALSSENSLLLWFAPGSISFSGGACKVDKRGKACEIFIDPAAVRGLWWHNQPIGPNEESTRRQVDNAVNEALLGCNAPHSAISPNTRENILKLLELEDVSTLGEEASMKKDDAPTQKSIIKKADLPKVLPPEEKGEAKPIDTSEEEPSSKSVLHSPGTVEIPKAFLGWSEPTSRWSTLGKITGTNDIVGLDMDHPKAVGIFGYMGSGKSYLLGTMIEGAVEPIQGINVLPAPLSVVVFNYRRNAADRFELSTLALPNQNPDDISRLVNDYGSSPQAIHNIHLLCLPEELTPARKKEYGNLPASELLFKPSTLTVEDWELLMGEPSSNAVFARTIRHALRELRSNVTLDGLEEFVLGMLKGQSRTAAELRFEFIRQYLSEKKGVDFNKLLKAGRVVILDLRQPLFNKGDALRFFLICSNYISRVQGQFNKIVIFDEAHEYLSEEFGEKLDARIRLMRHEGTSYIFATQDVGSIPMAVRRFLTTRFVFSLGTQENINDLLKIAPEFEGYDLLQMQPGQCLVQSTESVNGIFRRPRSLQVRPRVTQHGGTTRIFSQQK